MNQILAAVDEMDVSDLLALLGLSWMGLGVALVLSLGWALIIMATLVLAYVVLPDHSEAT